MRVLLCQTPRLTYVQAIELLQRETFGLPVDLALFPENAIEHPPQCTGEGDLTFENVAFLMLSRFAKQKKMYIVLGSVEERADDSRTYDTCVVINRDGELQSFYRKISTILLGKAPGTETGIFETEFGPVGLLLGTEIEDEQRWSELLALKPYLILNPARAPVQMDPVLIHTHPELQVAAWHQGLRHLEHVVETRTRQYPCSFARADAPFQDGGAGTSILVEPHRSMLAPRWNTAFFVVDTLHPYELEGRKLPGWRQLTIDERARLAGRDRALLTQEEIERGPRYLVWTLRPSDMGGLRNAGSSHWGGVAKRERMFVNLEALREGGLDQVTKRTAFLVPCTLRDGRTTYVSITGRGALLQWDVKMKRELASSTLGSTSITAVSSWKTPSQIAVVSSTRKMVSLRIFDDRSPIGGFSIDMNNDVKVHRKQSMTGGRKESVRDRRDAHDRHEVPKRMPPVSAIHHVHDNAAILIFEPLDEKSEVTARLVDLDDASMEELDIYGTGPPSLHDDEEEDDHVDSVVVIDKLVSTRMIHQRFRGRMQQVLVCLYDSNRLTQLTMDDQFLHEQMLLEDGATERQRNDMPLACVLMQSITSDAYNIIVSYQSATLRWWQVSLSQCKLQAHVTVTAAITHLAILDWPLSGGAGAGGAPAGAARTDKHDKKLPGLQASARRPSNSSQPPIVKVNRSSRASIFANGLGRPPSATRDRLTARSSLFTQSFEKKQEASLTIPSKIMDGPGRPSTVRVMADDMEGRGSSIPQQAPVRLSTAPPSARGSVAAARGRPSLKNLSVSRRGSSAESAFTRSTLRFSIARTTDMNSSDDQAAESRAGDDTFGPKDHGCLLVVAFDLAGGMPLFLARNGRIVKVYTCSDHFVEKSSKVEQLFCDGTSVAVQLSNADIRHFEFVLEDSVIKLTEVPMEMSA